MLTKKNLGDCVVYHKDFPFVVVYVVSHYCYQLKAEEKIFSQ